MLWLLPRDGLFLGRDIAGDFTAIIRLEADNKVLYDQAGLRMRVDARNWLKAGVEFSDDVTNFSTVATRNGCSDRSVTQVARIFGVQSIRLTRIGEAAITHFLDQAGAWQLMRLADFPSAAAVQIGPMACSPERAGFEARFLEFHIGPSIENPLHAS